MLIGASAAYHHAKAEQEIELVWTGPSSKLIATRKTEQALLQVIDAAKIAALHDELRRLRCRLHHDGARASAIDRGVEISMLLEASDKHGGGVSIDAIGKMKAALPTAANLFMGRKERWLCGR